MAAKSPTILADKYQFGASDGLITANVPKKIEYIKCLHYC